MDWNCGFREERGSSITWKGGGWLVSKGWGGGMGGYLKWMICCTDWNDFLCLKKCLVVTLCLDTTGSQVGKPVPTTFCHLKFVCGSFWDKINSVFVWLTSYGSKHSCLCYLQHFVFSVHTSLLVSPAVGVEDQKNVINATVDIFVNQYLFISLFWLLNLL